MKKLKSNPKFKDDLAFRTVLRQNYMAVYTDKKENQIFLIHRKIQNGAVAKPYTCMTNGLLIYGEIFAHFLIFGSPSSFSTFQLLHSEFPYI